MNMDSTRRAVTYPSASMWFWRLRIGYRTTAVATFATIRSNSSEAPTRMRVLSAPEPAM